MGMARLPDKTFIFQSRCRGANSSSIAMDKALAESQGGWVPSPSRSRNQGAASRMRGRTNWTLYTHRGPVLAHMTMNVGARLW
jgi:hypothetical protein